MSTITQAQFEKALAERLEMSKADIVIILDEQAALVTEALKSSKAFGPSEPVTIRGLAKFTVKETPAKKARKGVNPFNGEPMTFKAKPKGKRIRVLPIAALKKAV